MSNDPTEHPAHKVPEEFPLPQAMCRPAPSRQLCHRRHGCLRASEQCVCIAAVIGSVTMQERQAATIADWPICDRRTTADTKSACIRPARLICA